MDKKTKTGLFDELLEDKKIKNTTNLKTRIDRKHWYWIAIAGTLITVSFLLIYHFTKKPPEKLAAVKAGDVVNTPAAPNAPAPQAVSKPHEPPTSQIPPAQQAPPPEPVRRFADIPAAPNVAPPSGQNVKINYQSEATTYVEQMIMYARNTEKLLSVKQAFEKLSKPPKGDNPKARQLNDEALALIKQSRDNDALPILQLAYKTDPSDIEVVNNLAYAYFATNDSTTAKAMFVETLRLNPGRYIAWINMARMYAFEGNEYAATNCYINYYRFAKNQAVALKAIEKTSSDPHPILSKACAGAYQYISSVMIIR